MMKFIYEHGALSGAAIVSAVIMTIPPHILSQICMYTCISITAHLLLLSDIKSPEGQVTIGDFTIVTGMFTTVMLAIPEYASWWISCFLLIFMVLTHTLLTLRPQIATFIRNQHRPTVREPLIVKCKADDKVVNKPQRENGDAGWDLFPTHEDIIEPGQTVRIPLGVSFEIPPNHYGRLADRSSMGSKGLHVFGGVVDSSYRGEVSVVLFNSTKAPFIINLNKAICQMIITPCPDTMIEEIIELSDTSRGSGGFGSTDKA